MNAFSRNSRHGGSIAAALLVSTLAGASAMAQSLPAATAGSPSAPVTAPLATDIRDIRGPRPITSPWIIPLISMTALLAFGGIYGAWAWNRRRVRQNSKRPLDIALERLSIAEEWMKPSLARKFSIEVSSAVRDYIEGCFDVRAAHLTTDEFLHQMLEPADALLTAHRSLLDNFLQTCDLAKFGGWNLSAADMETLRAGALRFVSESAPAAAAPAAAPGASRPSSTASATYAAFPST